MKRALTKSEIGELVLRLVLAGYYPGQHFILTEDGQVLASPEARSFLKHTPVWASSERLLSR
ncbi:MAG: hypothetical protein ACFE0J_11540 [Elainellaceae cyanobacterium]